VRRPVHPVRAPAATRGGRAPWRVGRTRPAVLTVVALAVVAVAGCTARPAPADAPASGPPLTGSGAFTPPPSPVTLSAADWPTYHRDNARTGVAAAFPPTGTLRVAWRAALDDAVYGQPLVVGGRVLAATENDTVYGLDPATGRVLWSTHLGAPVPRADLPCGNIDPLGITSTMAFDPSTGLVFALAEVAGGQHLLYGLDPATGAVRLRRAAEPPRGDRLAHQQRSALTVLDGRVYVAYGGLRGDCARYIGSVLSVPTSGDGPLRSYAVPTTREGGIWAPGGAAVQGGRLLYPVGNGESTSRYDGSDSILALTADLALADRFTPSTRADDNDHDLDLGSMTPAVVSGYVYANGKRGLGYTLRADRLGGVGGQVAAARVCPAYGAAAVDGDTVYVPCPDGTRAVRVDAAGAITVRWRSAVPAAGSPVVGGGSVWVVDYDAGVLYALDQATGAVRQQVGIGRAPHFASPTLSAGRAYVGTHAGVVAVAGA
jgi:outer membrane protein assembly factor BamB